MYGLRENVELEIFIKKSRFLTKYFSVYTQKEAEEIIRFEKEKYRDATHVCYGYVLENVSKVSDDGEPSGTAGLPILNVLQKNHLFFTLCIVIRYFGGIKLGAGGLIRAYSGCAKKGIEQGHLVQFKEGIKIKLLFSYSVSKQVSFLIGDAILLDKDFSDRIIYTIKIQKEEYEKISTELLKIVDKMDVLEEIYIKENKL